MGRLIDENTITQKKLILDYMKKNKEAGISDTEARDLFGIRRLSGRILDLRREGYEIKTIWKNGKTRYGKKTRYGVYKLA